MDQTDTGVTAESIRKKTPNFSKEKPPFLGLYREDVVKSVSRPGVLGIITKVAGDSDSESSSDGEEEDGDDDDGDDDESTESLSEGCAQVYWMNSEENAESFDDIQVVDRSFVHGDIVALVASPSGQTGTVVNVDLLVDLELPEGETVTDVDSRSLKHIQPFSPGDYVIRDHWLGRVDEVVDNVTVMFNDGSKCKVMRADPMRLIPLPEGSMMDDSGCPYYPGQRVKASSSTLLKSAKWLRGSWKPSRIEGVVTEIEVGSVVVYWIVAAHAKAGAQPSAIPSEQQDPKDLKVMTYLSYTNWNLGDHALLSKKHRWKEGEDTSCAADVDQKGEAASASESAPVAKDGQPTETGWTPHRKKLRPRIGKHEKRPKRKGGAVVERASLVVNTRTKVDVVWQDGTCERGISACSLFPIDHLGDHEFWPGQYVQERGPEIEGFGSETQRVGVVKTVDSKQRTAVVKWLQQPEGSDEERKFEKEEVVSVYELVEHPDYSYSLGDVVIRLCSSLDVSEALNTSEPDDSETLPPSGFADNPENGDGTKQLSSTEGKASGESKRGKTKTKNQNSDLSWVGFIIGLEDGDIEVAWGNGSVSKVGPQAVFVVGRDEGDESTQSSDIGDIEDMDDAGSWETVDPSDVSDQETVQPSNQRKWSKKVQQEWGILEKNLPDTIYVRVYEDRMELLRSVIVGAAGTPYQDGLFVFDICFPPEYPTVPPLVHYHSGGLRLNPNLYETGKVCLSLINTWTGKGTEVWHPSSSSILQVLVSIQGLVLNTKPYFNEAGYDKQLGTVEGEKNSLAYSENSFLLSCKTMLYLLRRPPKHLEGLVQEHFKHRGPFILRACNAYMQGAPVGYLRDDATLPSDVGSDNTSSVGFRLILAKLIPRLFEAFTQIGADCQHLAPAENPK